MKVGSDGTIILRLEILKKIIMTIILAVTIPISVRAVAMGHGPILGVRPCGERSGGAQIYVALASCGLCVRCCPQQPSQP